MAAMDESTRRAYLRAMGIDLWVQQRIPEAGAAGRPASAGAVASAGDPWAAPSTEPAPALRPVPVDPPAAQASGLMTPEPASGSPPSPPPPPDAPPDAPQDPQRVPATAAAPHRASESELEPPWPPEWDSAWEPLPDLDWGPIPGPAREPVPEPVPARVPPRPPGRSPDTPPAQSRRPSPAAGRPPRPAGPAAPAVPSPRPAAAPAVAAPPPAGLALDPAVLDWDALAAAVAGCRACALCETRTQTVFGVGDRDADLLVIGEAPGADEDRAGEPFVGRAGQLLNRMLAAIGRDRSQVYIANILKCRPPGNRDPRAEEVLRCQGYLARQAALVRPRVILAVGRIAAQNLLATDAPVGRLRGRWLAYGPEAIPLRVTYHPAYLLRSPDQKARAWEDLVQVARRLAAGAGTDRVDPAPGDKKL